MSKIYLEGLGQRDTVKDIDQIKWFMESVAKARNGKSRTTKYWLDLYESYYTYLLKHESFELLMFIESKLTQEKIDNRIKWRLNKQLEYALQEAKWEEWREDYTRKNNIIKGLNYN